MGIVLCVVLPVQAKVYRKVKHIRHHRRISWAPRPVLQRYLNADFGGSKLRKDPHAATVEDVTWDSEPAWNHIMVVGRFWTGRMRIWRFQSRILVQYTDLGELKGDRFYRSSHVEKISFALRRVHWRWKVDRPILVPHVSVGAAIQYVKKELGSAKPGSDSAVALQQTLAQLKGLQKP